jgi:hypothetical protein
LVSYGPAQIADAGSVELRTESTEQLRLNRAGG